MLKYIHIFFFFLGVTLFVVMGDCDFNVIGY